MASYEFEDLKKTYDGLDDPFVVIKIDDKNVGDPDKGFPISDLYVDLTSGYEASIASGFPGTSFMPSTRSLTGMEEITRSPSMVYSAPSFS